MMEEKMRKNKLISPVYSEDYTSNKGDIIIDEKFSDKMDICEQNEKSQYLSYLFQKISADNVAVQCKQCGSIICNATQVINENRKRLLMPNKNEMIHRHICLICNQMSCKKIKIEKHILEHIIAKEVVCISCRLNEKPDAIFVRLSGEVFPSALISVYCGYCQKLFCRGDEVIDKYIGENYREIKSKSKIMFSWKCGVCENSTNSNVDRNQMDIHHHLWIHMIRNEICCHSCQEVKEEREKNRIIQNFIEKNLK